MARLVGTWKMPPQMAGDNPLRVPGVRIRSTPAGLEVLLSKDTVAVGPASSWAVTATLGCQLWGSPGVLYLTPGFAYMTFARPGNAQLYAIEQSAWAALYAGTDVLPLAWVDSHDALTPRLAFTPTPVFVPTVPGWSGGTKSVPFNNYGTVSHGNWGDVTGGGGHSGGGAWMGGADFMGAHRVAVNDPGNVLVAIDDGTLWYLTGQDTLPGTQVQWATGVYDYVLGINYNFTTTTWWLLTKEGGAGGTYGYYKSTAAAPLTPADWTPVAFPHTAGLQVVLGIGPDGALLYRDTAFVHNWAVYRPGVSFLDVSAFHPLDSQIFTAGARGFATQTLFSGTTISLGCPNGPVPYLPGVLDATATYDDNLYSTGLPLPPIAATDDGAGGLYALCNDSNLYQRPGAYGTNWNFIMPAVAAGFNTTGMFQVTRSDPTKYYLESVVNPGVAGVVRLQVLHPSTSSATSYTWPFDTNSDANGGAGTSNLIAVATNN